MKEMESWYHRHLSLTPLDRIQHEPVPPKHLQQERWQRLERRIASMILQAVPEGVRDEPISAGPFAGFQHHHIPALLVLPRRRDGETGVVQESRRAYWNCPYCSCTISVEEMDAMEETIGGDRCATPPDPTLLLKSLNNMTPPQKKWKATKSCIGVFPFLDRPYWWTQYLRIKLWKKWRIMYLLRWTSWPWLKTLSPQN